ncbi:hypothetical protein Vretifemale_13640, partial [Volvox reticuliferus]
GIESEGAAPPPPLPLSSSTASAAAAVPLSPPPLSDPDFTACGRVPSPSPASSRCSIPELGGCGGACWCTAGVCDSASASLEPTAGGCCARPGPKDACTTISPADNPCAKREHAKYGNPRKADYGSKNYLASMRVPCVNNR